MIDYTLTINYPPHPSFKMYLDKDFPSDSHILNAMKVGGSYESEITQVLVRALRPGDTAFDVGANVGYFTFLMVSLVGPAGRVVAFEPGENNLPRLRDNIKLNKLDNVDVVEQPVWSHKTELQFWLCHDSSGGNALWDPGKWPDNEKSRAVRSSRMLKTTTLDATFLRAPRVIKMDIEGAEYHALIGAHGLLRTYKPPFILVEWNRFALEQMECTGSDLRHLMASHGYEMFLIDSAGKKPELIPKTLDVNFPASIIVNVMFSTPDAVDEIWERADEPVVG
jgi:FkbM family methyltransferase